MAGFKLNLNPLKLPARREPVEGYTGPTPGQTGILAGSQLLAQAIQQRAQRKAQMIQAQALENVFGVPKGNLQAFPADQQIQIGKEFYAPQKPVVPTFVLPQDYGKNMTGVETFPGKVQQTYDTGPGSKGGVRQPDDFLRSEYDKASEPWKAARLGFDEGMAAAQEQTGVGDASLIRAIVKTAEGKGARVSNDDAKAFISSGSLPQNLQAYALKAINGEKLAPKVREQFISLLNSYYGKSKMRQEGVNVRYRMLANHKGIPENLMGFHDLTDGKSEMSMSDAELAKALKEAAEALKKK